MYYNEQVVSGVWELSTNVSLIASMIFLLFIGFRQVRETVSGWYLTNLFLDSVEIEEKELFGSLGIMMLLFMIPGLNLFFIIPFMFILPLLILLGLNHSFKLDFSDTLISYIILISLTYGIILSMLSMGIWSLCINFKDTLKEKYQKVNDQTDLNLKEFNELNSNDKHEHSDM